MASTLEILLRRQQPAQSTGSELAGALRRQQSLGDIMQLSGHSTVAPMGARLSQQATEMAAAELQRRREEAALERDQLRYNEAREHRDKMYALARTREARQRESARQQGIRADRAYEAAQKKDLRNRAHKIQQMMVNNGVVDLDSELKTLEGLMRSAALEQGYGQGQFPKGIDLPGFGGLTFLQPEFTMSPEAKAMRSAYQSVLNAISSEKFGASQTNQEVRRLTKQMLVDLESINKDEDLYIVIPRIREGVEAVKREIQKSADPEIHEFIEGNLDWLEGRGGEDAREAQPDGRRRNYGFVDDDDDENVIDLTGGQ